MQGDLVTWSLVNWFKFRFAIYGITAAAFYENDIFIASMSQHISLYLSLTFTYL
jgi:hypothetical protein